MQGELAGLNVSGSRLSCAPWCWLHCWSCCVSDPGPKCNTTKLEGGMWRAPCVWPQNGLMAMLTPTPEEPLCDWRGRARGACVSTRVALSCGVDNRGTGLVVKARSLCFRRSGSGTAVFFRKRFRKPRTPLQERSTSRQAGVATRQCQAPSSPSALTSVAVQLP